MSFLAFLFGSLLGDLTGLFVRVTRPGEVPTTLTAFIGDEPNGLTKLSRMEMRSEVERVQASLDRLNGEIQLRLGLIPSAVVIGVYAAMARWVFGAVHGGRGVGRLLPTCAQEARHATS